MRMWTAMMIVAAGLLVVPCARAWQPGANPAAKAPGFGGFAGLIGGEWKMTSQAGTSMFDRWEWGPGNQSIRVMTHGEAADGSPWRAVRVLYWHPGKKQVRVLTVQPFQEGVSEGVIAIDGKKAEGVNDLYQIKVHRKIVERWTIESGAKYRLALLEEVESKLAPLVEFEYDHVDSPPTAGVAPDAAAMPAHLKSFEPFVGHEWRGTGAEAPAVEASTLVQSHFEWVPFANCVCLRVTETRAGGTTERVLDAYFYRHTGMGVVRCLALSNRGGVYEGEVSTRENGGLEVKLKGYESDRVSELDARLDLDSSGSLGARIWGAAGGEAVLLVALQQTKVVPKDTSAR